MPSLPRTFLRQPLTLCLLGAAAVPLLAGCGGGGGGGNGGGGGGTPLSASAVASNGLTVSVSENTAFVAVGGAVTYTLTLTNNTSAAITIHASSATAPPAVLHIVNPAGADVYDTIPPPPLTDVILAPGQSLSQSVPLTVFATAGAYKTTGSFSFSDGTAATVVGPLTVTAQ